MRFPGTSAVRAARAAVLGLALLPAAGDSGCTSVIADSDCYDIIAVDVQVSGGVTTGSVRVEVTDEACPLMSSMEFTTYANFDGQAGYDATGDQLVKSYSAEVVQPSSELGINSFSSQGHGGAANATHWQATIVDSNGGTSTFSGTFG